MSAAPHQVNNSRQCPYCREWVILPYRRTHEAWEAHKRRCAPEPHAADCDAGTTTPSTADDDRECPSCGYQLGMRYVIKLAPGDRSAMLFCCEPCRTGVADPAPEAQPETVKRAALWGGCIDTYQSEAELNGWRATQGALLNVPPPPPPAPSNQGVLL